MLPGYNKAVQVGRTVINFSVKHLQKPGESAGMNIEQIQSEVAGTIEHSDVGCMGVVKANSKLTAPTTNDMPQRMQRRASEREMPSAEEQFQA